MKMTVLKMKIMDQAAGSYRIRIERATEEAELLFDPINKSLGFSMDTPFSVWLQGHERQLRAMLHNKRLDTFYPGFELTFAMREGKDVAAYNDRTKLVVLDKRGGKNRNYVIDQSDQAIDHLYTDASFMEEKGIGGIAVIHKNPAGDYRLIQESVVDEGSCRLELLAAVRGLEEIGDVDKVRIVTDSQYVRKGLTEWIVNWELNDWMTINGEKVKNIEVWQRFDRLTRGKYIEFAWVKGHNDHFENTLCDLYAKSASNGVGQSAE